MNRDQLKKNVGTRVELVPKPLHLSASNQVTGVVNSEWVIKDIGDVGVTIANDSTRHSTILGFDHVHHFTSDPERSIGGTRAGFLTLNVQLYVQGNAVRPYPNARPGESVWPTPNRHGELSAEAKIMLREAVASTDGGIMRVAHLGGTDIGANGKTFVKAGDARSVAKWEAAIAELEARQLIKSLNAANSMYRVLQRGYESLDPD